MKRGTAGYALYASHVDDRLQFHEVAVPGDVTIKCKNPGCGKNIKLRASTRLRHAGTIYLAWAYFVRREGLAEMPQLAGYFCEVCMNVIRGKENIKQTSFDELTGITEDTANNNRQKRKGRQ